MKDKFETFRASENERQELKRMAKKSQMSKSDYIRHCIFNKEITVIDGLDEFAKQLKAIGNNLNQLTTRANMGHFEAVNLAETKEQLGAIYDLLQVFVRVKQPQKLLWTLEKVLLLSCKLKFLRKIYHSKSNLKKNAMAFYRS
jgi:hypothetical protein